MIKDVSFHFCTLWCFKWRDGTSKSWIENHLKSASYSVTQAIGGHFDFKKTKYIWFFIINIAERDHVVLEIADKVQKILQAKCWYQIVLWNPENWVQYCDFSCKKFRHFSTKNQAKITLHIMLQESFQKHFRKIYVNDGMFWMCM